MQNQLSIRVNANNPDHHLWNNHGVWWIHYTVLEDGLWQRRVRRSLKTRDRAVARQERDRLLSLEHDPSTGARFQREQASPGPRSLSSPLATEEVSS